VRRRGPRSGIIAALALALTVAAGAAARPPQLAGATARPPQLPGATARPPYLAAGAAARPPQRQLDSSGVDVSVGSTPIGGRMPNGFVGLSLEYPALHRYTGRDPRAVDPVLVALIRGLDPRQAPVLRIGGNSADHTWWPERGVVVPGGVSYRLTKGWLRTTGALAAELGARMIMGIDLAARRPALAAAEARAILQGIGRRYVAALEIGNEPDLYGIFPWYRDLQGHVLSARAHRYNLGSYINDFSRWRAVLPDVPLAGPAFSATNWMSGLDRFLSAEPGVGVVTFHRYPLRACVKDATSPSYASIANLLSNVSSSGLAQSVASYVAAAHARGLPFRVGEMNSASCEGRAGVSDTFASALWVLDTLFAMASVGVDGVNVHSLPGAAYELFTVTHPGGQWQAFVHPEYYGMLLFGQAFPPGARLLPASAPSGPVRAWATSAPDGRTHVVLINKDSAAHTVRLQMPTSLSSATLEWLQAPSAASTSGVTLGSRSFGPETTTGTLPGSPVTQPVIPLLGTYTIDMPAASAVMLTR
jgi:hypothetical protein